MHAGKRNEIQLEFYEFNRELLAIQIRGCYAERSEGVCRQSAILRFVLDDERAGVYDNLGATCAQTVEKAVSDMESDELCEIWRGLDDEE